MNVDPITLQAGTAAILVRTLADLVTRSFPNRPAWAPPAIALVCGILVVLLLQVASGVVLNPQTVAQGILAGISAGGGAIASAELTKSAESAKVQARAGQDPESERVISREITRSDSHD